MTTRPQRGIEAVNTAMDAGEPTVQLVRIGGIPRAALTVAEFAAITTLDRRRVYALIDTGEVRVINVGAKHYVIPTSELAAWQAKARPLDRTA